MVHTMEARGFDAPPQTVDLTTLKMPVYRSRLVAVSGSWIMAFAKPMPCRWWRFWQWLLLGWRWEALSDA